MTSLWVPPNPPPSPSSSQTQTLSNCGDAIRLTVTPGSDINNCLDNTIWFTSITNSLVGG